MSELDYEYSESITKKTFQMNHIGVKYSEKLSHSLWRAVAAEFVGMTLFIWISIQTAIYTTGDPSASITKIAFAFGLAIAVVVYALAGISGGHFNPWVTLGLTLTKQISVVRAKLYITAQILGALLGTAFAKAINNGKFEAANGAANSVISTSIWGAILAEGLGTYLLVLTVLFACDTKRGAIVNHLSVLAPLLIGFAVFLAHIALIPITNCSINLARSLGSAIIANYWKDFYVFIVGPLLGSVFATCTFVYIFQWRDDIDE